MEGFEEVTLTGQRFWVVWNDTDDAGYDHQVSLRDHEGRHIWTFKVDPTDAIVDLEITESVIQIFKADGWIVSLDLATGSVVANTFAK
jgi:hypothetical protein